MIAPYQLTTIMCVMCKYKNIVQLFILTSFPGTFTTTDVSLI